MKGKRLLSAAVSAVLTLTGLTGTGALTGTAPVYAATRISLSPMSHYVINEGVFQGWGSSLCWWANRVGYNDELSQKAADAFYGENGLRMNIARFNIGGGDDPTHHHITRTDSNMPGYTVYNNGQVTYDWTADANQRNVLDRCIKAAGDDMIVEMFSNSPPYYMTKSGCSTGNKDAGQNNLRDDQYTAFAEYLAEVCNHFEKDWGVTVQSIDPMNEPYTNFWGAYSAKQEGCHFDIGNSESRILTELKKSLSARGLNDIIISASDETSIDTQIDAFKALSSEAKGVVGRIDTHSYGGSKRSELKETALAAGKNLWMSEVDGKGTAGQNAGGMGAALWLAGRITDDCNGLNASAWILWQLIDNHVSSVGYNGNKDSGMPNINDGFWGVAVADHDKNEIILSKKYYGFGQYTRYIRPGMIMLNSGSNTMAAFDKENGKLVIVAYNTGSGNNQMIYDLSGFDEVGSISQVIRTSTSENWAEVSNAGSLSGKTLDATLAPLSITTYIIDGVKGSMSLEDPIDLGAASITGSDPWGESSNCGPDKVFDGKMSTYFDGVGAGWVQADLGEVYDISAVGFCPRSGYEARMVDGIFSFSEDGTNWSEAFTVSSLPPFGMQYVKNFACDSKARYIRYNVPQGAPNNGINKDSVYCCNIAEIELYGKPASQSGSDKITPARVTGSDPYKDSPNDDASKVFDGKTTTFFDGVGAGWVQADLGGNYRIDAISFSPRKGYEYRMADGFFSVSSDGETWNKVYTVEGQPAFGMKRINLDGLTNVRYIRYEVPEGAPNNGINKDSVYCCNIAEIAVYGEEMEPTTEPEPATQPPTKHVTPGGYFKDENEHYIIQMGQMISVTAEGSGYEVSTEGDCIEIVDKETETEDVGAQIPKVTTTYIIKAMLQGDGRIVLTVGGNELDVITVHVLGDEYPPTVNDTLYGDVNLDGKVNVADAVGILQYVANQTKYPIEEQGLINGDVDGQPGITGNDAITIQKVDAGILKNEDLPLGQ